MLRSITVGSDLGEARVDKGGETKDLTVWGGTPRSDIGDGKTKTARQWNPSFKRLKSATAELNWEQIEKAPGAV